MPTADERRARRAWIAAHHPDRGGDPQEFAAGLAALTGGRVGDARSGGDGPDRRPTVVRSKHPVRTLRRLARRVTRARRRRTHHGVL